METETNTQSSGTAPDTSSMSAALRGMQRLLGGKRTLAAARGISEQALDSIYGVARQLYANGHHAEALRSFELLCLYDHENARNWWALGVCRQAVQDYAGAAAALAFATGQFGEPDLELQLNLLECLIGAGEREAAENVLGRLSEAVEEGALDENQERKIGFLESQLRHRQ